MQLIILAAGQGTRLNPITLDQPKCLTKVLDKPLLYWQFMAAQQANISDIVIIGGFCIEKIYTFLEEYNFTATVIKNQEYASTDMVYSLFCAEDFLAKDSIVSYGDIIYHPDILKSLINVQANNKDYDILVTIDKNWLKYWQMRFANPLDDAESLKLDANNNIIQIGQKEDNIDNIMGQYIGLNFFTKAGFKHLKTNYLNNKKQHMTDILNKISKSEYLLANSIDKPWYEIDNLDDLKIANDMSRGIIW